jgi:flavin-dependent dehydrogenase
VHPFWSSYEEKQPWLELSVGGGHGRSWSIKGGAMGELTRVGREGQGVGQGGTAVGDASEVRRLLGEGCHGAVGGARFCALCSACCVREEEISTEEREEKREKTKEEGKEKKKRRKMGKKFKLGNF